MGRGASEQRAWGWLLVERLAWAGGVVGVAVWAVVGAAGTVGSREELASFARRQATGRMTAGAPDLRLWSPERLRAWRETQIQSGSAPLAVLRIKRIGVEAAVLEGTDDWTLNRAVGHIEDTALPGAAGNSGIAGHRDGFFRALKDIADGDALEIETERGVDDYRVERIWIVDPDDVSVLDPTPSPSVTLVTCYPFYYIGSAPQRFIVRAVRVESSGRPK